MVATDSITITVAGPPVAKGRARVLKSGHSYTPAKTRKYEAHIRMAAQVAMKGRPPLEGALRIYVVAVVPIPVSFSKVKRQRALNGIVAPTKRPDGDNFLKAAMDGCTGIVWRDDAQIVRISIAKTYGEVPSLKIVAWQSGHEPA